jgi:predicted deacylase
VGKVFPGAPDGPLTRQMAHRLMQAAMAASDAVVDLHSGGVEAVVPYYALYWQDGSEASRRAGMLARATGAATIWTATDAWLSGSLMVQLTRAGKPALIVECGGGGPMPDEHIGLFASAVENIAHEMGILPGKPVLPSRRRLIGSCSLVFAREGGFFVPACGPGDILEGGAAFGQIVDLYGDSCETIVSDMRAFIAAVGRPWLPVHSGALIGELNDDLGFEDRSG